jgi:flagellar hook-basal body complex protein FliE
MGGRSLQRGTTSRHCTGALSPTIGVIGKVRCFLERFFQEPAVDVRLKPFNFEQAVARAGVVLPGQQKAARVESPGTQVGFSEALTNALKSVSQSQHQAAALQREVQLDNPNVSLEETMIAMQKAQIGFQSALHVRNRLVQAYSDIMNMTV